MEPESSTDYESVQELFLLYSQAVQEYSSYVEDTLQALEVLKKRREEIREARRNAENVQRARVARLIHRLENLYETTIRRCTGLTVDQFKEVEKRFMSKNPAGKTRTKLAMFLYWLSTGYNFTTVCSVFGGSESTVSADIFKTLDEFIAILPDTIRLPNRMELNDIGAGFIKLCGHEIFGKVAGVLGCYHFPIKFVDEHYPKELYLSKNSCYSLQLQIVIDNTGKILNIFVGKPGSYHKQNVLKESSLYVSQNRYPPPGYFLLADHEYSCILKPIAVITPFKDSISLSSREVVFNGRYKKAQDVLSNALRMLSKRWKILEKDLEHSLGHNIKIITTCCIIYNILGEKIVIDTSNDFNFFVSDEPSLDESLDDNDEASYFRDCLINNL